MPYPVVTGYTQVSFLQCIQTTASEALENSDQDDEAQVDSDEMERQIRMSILIRHRLIGMREVDPGQPVDDSKDDMPTRRL